MRTVAFVLVLVSSCAAPVGEDSTEHEICAAPVGEDSTKHVIISSEFIAEKAPTPQCHASTIVEVAGRLMAAWFGGRHEGSPDVGIWLSQKDTAGWSTPVEVALGGECEGQRYPCWNPVLHKSRQGPLLLFYKVGPNPQEWWGMLKSSSDCGVMWSAPVRLPDGVIGPDKNKPVEFDDGDILCPSSTEENGWCVWLEWTSDLGVTWRRMGPLNDAAVVEAIQPSILKKTERTLQAVGRTKQGRMFSMESTDGGMTWTKMHLLNFWCANSGVDGVVLRDGRMLVVYNHRRNSPEMWDAERNMLNVAVSTDGYKWKGVCVLEHEPWEEFSYPSVIQTSDGLVHITYTWKRQRIRHVVLDPLRIEGRDFRGWEWE